MDINEEKNIILEEEKKEEATVKPVEKETVKPVEKTSTQQKKTSTRDEEIESLKKLIESLSAQVLALKSTTTQQPTVVLSTPSTDVTLVYMSDSLGVVQTNNTVLNCTRFGEEFVLPRNEFDAIVGKYRHWFERGILAVSSKNIDVAAAKGIKTDAEYKINSDILSRIGSMSLTALEELWNNMECDAHKLSISTYYKRKLMEGKDESFKDRARLDLMNRLTNGGFAREITEISGRDLKIRPTELN